MASADPDQKLRHILYGPLSTAEKEIRIMEINRAPPLEAEQTHYNVQCSLKQVPLREANPFYALSYVWGDADNTGVINIEDQSIRIRHNLWLFLQALLKRFPPQIGSDTTQHSSVIRVWVDSVCIDQENLLERSSQVSIMGDIYRSADGVYAWLGPATNESDAWFDYVHRVETLKAQSLSSLKIATRIGHSASGLEDVAGRAYWSRLWIIQEVILPRQIWFMAGNRFADAKGMSGALETHQIAASTHVYSRRSLQRISNHLSRRATFTHGTVALHDLVEDFRDAGCSDMRDKIYGFLALIDAESSSKIHVDYHKSLLRVLLETSPMWTWAGTVHGPWQVDGQKLGQEDRYHIHNYAGLALKIASITGRALSVSDCRNSTTAGVSPTTSFEMVASGHNLRGTTNAADLTTIAVATSAGILPISQVNELTGIPKTFISVVADQQCYWSIFYTTGLPRRGDQLYWTPKHVWLVRNDSTASPGSKENHKLAGLGLGRMPFSNQRALRDIVLPDPWTWMHRHRDSDCSPYVQASKHGDSVTSNDITIVCDTATIGTMLRDEFWLQEIYSRSHRNAIDPTEREQDIDTWRPYSFGLKHGVLESCHTCRFGSKAGGKGRGPRGSDGLLSPRTSMHRGSDRYLRHDRRFDREQCACRWKT